MRLAHRINPDGWFHEDVALDDDAPLPVDCIAERPPPGLQWPRHVNGAWVDGGVPFTVDAAGVPQFPIEE